MQLAEISKHLRKRFKIEDLDVRVRVAPGGGAVQVIAPAYDKPMSEEVQARVKFIAKVNHMTRVRGMEIDISRHTDPMQFDFYIQQ